MADLAGGDKLSDKIPYRTQYVTPEKQARWQEIVDDLPRLQELPLLEQLRDRGNAMKNVPLFAVNMMSSAAEEIELLRDAIRRLADQDATLSLLCKRDGSQVVTVTMDATLTDAEREFLQNLRGAYEELANQTGYVNAASQKEARTFADLIGSLLERLGGK